MYPHGNKHTETVTLPDFRRPFGLHHARLLTWNIRNGSDCISMYNTPLNHTPRIEKYQNFAYARNTISSPLLPRHHFRLWVSWKNWLTEYESLFRLGTSPSFSPTVRPLSLISTVSEWVTKRPAFPGRAAFLHLFFNKVIKTASVSRLHVIKNWSRDSTDITITSHLSDTFGNSWYQCTVLVVARYTEKSKTKKMTPTNQTTMSHEQDFWWRCTSESERFICGSLAPCAGHIYILHVKLRLAMHVGHAARVVWRPAAGDAVCPANLSNGLLKSKLNSWSKQDSEDGVIFRQEETLNDYRQSLP